MHILLGNDDGVHAPGLAALAEALAGAATVWVAAPQREHSAQSHAFTLHKPLRVSEVGERWYGVSGTPADAIYVGLHALLPERPACVVSGINLGSNLGWDVHYSGTVAAAREAAFPGVPSVAVSLYVRRHKDPIHWATAQHVARRVVRRVLAHGLPRHTFLNVNVPNVPLPELRGVRLARLGVRRYEAAVEQRVDPRGRPYCWIGGRHEAFDDDPGTDGRLCEAGYATVTPMQADPTDHVLLADLRAAWDPDAA